MFDAIVWICVLELNLALEMYWNKQVVEREILHMEKRALTIDGAAS